jgi:porin
MMGHRMALSLSFVLVLGLAGSAGASANLTESASASPEGVTEDQEERLDWPESGALTNRFWGLADQLAEYGIEVGVGSTNIYQANVKNGLGTHQQSGRFTGSYDLEIAADLQRLLGLRGLGLFVRAEGGWPQAEGIDETMVGSVSGVNADATGNRHLDLVEVIFEWSSLDNRMNVMAGKIDAARYFDASEYANYEVTQFVNGALVNNLTIPLPDCGLGVVLAANLTDSWSIAAGVVDAEADRQATGFRTTFDGDDYFFYALETTITSELDSPSGPLPGNYRFGLWYDPQPKAHSDSEMEYRDDVGFYTSIDQMLFRESDDPENSQGLGLFARYGYADAKRNDIGSFWSLGVQYQGLPEGRDDDVLGLGFAQSVFSNAANITFTADHESVLELYYSAQIAPWIAVSPSVQYLSHPGGNRAVNDALVVGVRAQITF